MTREEDAERRSSSRALLQLTSRALFDRVVVHRSLFRTQHSIIMHRTRIIAQLEPAGTVCLYRRNGE